MAKLIGKVCLTNLPPRTGVLVNLAFFRVSQEVDPAPFDSDPPPDRVTDVEELVDDVHLETEKCDRSLEWKFEIERSVGFYYLQLSVVLFRSQNGRKFAQSEQFFFRRRPISLPAEGVILGVPWPEVPLEKLHRYGTVNPRKRL